MKFYVASYIGELEQTQHVQAEILQRGHEITVDWTSYSGVPSYARNAKPDEVAAIALRDLEGIQDADVFILLAGVADGRAKYAELGAALISAVQNGKPKIYVIGNHPVDTVFYFHPKVKRVTSLGDAMRDLGLD